MIYMSKTVVIAFSLLTFFSLSSFAGSQNHTDVFPNDFFRDYYMRGNGEIINTKANQIVGEGFGLSKKDQTLAWSVKSEPCAQNKSLQCVGIYTQTSTKVKGNSNNPLSPQFNEAGFVMLKINHKDGEKNTLVKCNSSFTQNLLRDGANIANCVEYSKESCQKWADYKSQNAEKIKKLIAKKSECEDVMKSADEMNVNLRNIFQGEITKSQKDIEGSFDATTHPSRVGIGAGTSTQFVEDKISPYVSVYTDMFARNGDCAKFDDFFVKNYEGTNSSRTISSEEVSSKPGKRPSARKTKKAN